MNRNNVITAIVVAVVIIVLAIVMFGRINNRPATTVDNSVPSPVTAPTEPPPATP
jgi:uncharacterized membrane protein YvbJ